MKVRLELICAFAAMSLGACATVPTEELAANKQTCVESITTCRTPKECEARWAAARNWMLSNCGFRLEHVEPDYLETYKSGDYANTDLYCRVTKTPIGETAYRIELVAGANNFMIYGAAAKLAFHQRFNDSVNGAWRREVRRGRPI